MADVVVSQVVGDDDAGLDELLAFGWKHGRPRATSAAEYRRIVEFDAVDWQGFVARDAGGAICAAAQATISPSIGLDQAQLNAFFEPAAEVEFAAVLDAVDTWARERDVEHVTVHLSDPSEPVVAAWHRAGFVDIGERQRVVRVVRPDDAELEAVGVDGVDVFALADRPELAADADALWRLAHDDVPSALRFSSDDVRPLREELQLGDRDVFPPFVLIAVTERGEVAGLAVGIDKEDGTAVGHRMTVTARDWRGRGVARALKVEQIRLAAVHGVQQLIASNDDANAPMRAINDRLGYAVDYRLALLRRATDLPDSMNSRMSR